MDKGAYVETEATVVSEYSVKPFTEPLPVTREHF